MLALLFATLASATHVTTYEPDVLRTKAPFAGMETLVLDDVKTWISQLQPTGAPTGVVEKLVNGPGGSPSVLVFHNPMNGWAWMTINGTKVGTINPYATMTLEGVKPGWYVIMLEVPTGFQRTFAVQVEPPPPPPAPPPPPDTDNDGIVDDKDRCPAAPETVNNFNDRDGCPDEVPKAVLRFAGAIQGINFKTNEAVILPTSDTILKEALKVLKTYPRVAVEIQGHTDSVGDDAANLSLSQARAEAVMKWFVDRGIAAERLTAVGYGESKPVDSNDTEDGKAKNRRVEFQLSQPEEAEKKP